MRIRLLIVWLLVSAACKGQSLLKTPITFTTLSGTTGQFLDSLNRAPGIAIGYSNAVVNLSKKIQLSGKEKTVEDILKVICSGQPITYYEQDGKIFLTSTNKKKCTIRGYIIDRKTGERLIGASIYAPGIQKGTTSNIYGFYSLTLEQDLVALQISYTGYYTHSDTLQLQSDVLMNVELEQHVALHEMVVVQAGKSFSSTRTLTGKTDVGPFFVKSVPAVLGEADVMKALQLLPGIQSGNEGTSGLNVRGGSADQNLILLDGVPVYNASHAFGLFSIFNPDALNNVEILKGGFPSSYGGRLSSVVDVHMKEGDKYNLHGEGGLGLIFSKLMLEGPIKKEKSSFLIAVRRTYADFIVGPITKASDIRIIPYFTDANAKANFTLGKKDHLYFSFYGGEDKMIGKDKYTTDEGIHTKTEDGFSWGNITAMTRWNHVFNKKTFSNFTFIHTRYRFHARSWEEEKTSGPPQSFESGNTYFSSIRDWSIKADIDYLPTPRHFIKTGISATWHKYRPGVTRSWQFDDLVHIDEQVDNGTVTAGEYDAYIEDDIKISRRLKTNAGTRLSLFDVRGKVFSALQPRVNVLYNIYKGWSLKASYGHMVQYIHLLSNNQLGLPTDLWLPVTNRVPPQTSRQVAAGISWSHESSLTVSMEAYYKTLKNVIDYNQRTVFLSAYQNWEDVIQTGTGKSKGIEWLIQKKKGKLTWITSYTLSKSTRQFANINDGKEFPFTYDRRHEIKMALVWRKSARFEIGTDWFYSSGRAITIPSGTYYDPFSNWWVDVFDTRNNYRLPDYHRLDLSFKFMKQKKKYLRTWLVSIYNVYNRLNPFYMEETAGSDENKKMFRTISVFPIIPSISYQFKF